MLFQDYLINDVNDDSILASNIEITSLKGISLKILFSLNLYLLSKKYSLSLMLTCILLGFF